MPGTTMWVSRAALLLVLSSAAAALLAGVGSRAGWWHFRIGFQILTWAAYRGWPAPSSACWVVSPHCGGVRYAAHGLRSWLWASAS